MYDKYTGESTIDMPGEEPKKQSFINELKDRWYNRKHTRWLKKKNKILSYIGEDLNTVISYYIDINNKFEQQSLDDQLALLDAKHEDKSPFVKTLKELMRKNRDYTLEECKKLIKEAP